MTRKRAIVEIIGTLIAIILGIVAGLIWLGIAADQSNAQEDTLNQVEDWCLDADHGIKLEPVSTPFVVPEPPEGATWTLLVLKAGTANHTVTSPQPQMAYSHPSGQEISHVILCWENGSSSSTTSSSTTTSAPTSTTITDPTGTSSSTSTSTTLTEATTITQSPPGTATPTTTTVPPTTPTTETPVGGVPAGGGATAGVAGWRIIAGGVGLLLAAVLLAAYVRAGGWRWSTWR